MLTQTRTRVDPALIADVRAAVGRHAPWQETAERVAEALVRNLPTPDVFTPAQRLGDQDGYRSHLLHTEPDGAFSVVGLVWLPGQQTPIHDHVTWCSFVVIQGVEHEDLYTLDGDHLVAAGANVNRVGEVSGFAPPGDIHRVHNSGTEVAMSIHIYGTDISRIGSSVRRYYDLPIKPA